MALLKGGIPLSLLFDLVCGPHSADLLSHERDLASSDWIRPLTAVALP
jgi:hypothetical protein